MLSKALPSVTDGNNSLPCCTVFISSASASGISIANSCCPKKKVSHWLVIHVLKAIQVTNLLHCHNDLDCIQTIQTKILGKCRRC